MGPRRNPMVISPVPGYIIETHSTDGVKIEGL